MLSRRGRIIPERLNGGHSIKASAGIPSRRIWDASRRNYSRRAGKPCCPHSIPCGRAQRTHSGGGGLGQRRGGTPCRRPCGEVERRVPSEAAAGNTCAVPFGGNGRPANGTATGRGARPGQNRPQRMPPNPKRRKTRPAPALQWDHGLAPPDAAEVRTSAGPCLENRSGTAAHKN